MKALLLVVAASLPACWSSRAAMAGETRVKIVFHGWGPENPIGSSKRVWRGAPLKVFAKAHSMVEPDSVLPPLSASLELEVAKCGESGGETVAVEFILFNETSPPGRDGRSLWRCSDWVAWNELRPGEYVLRVSAPPASGLSVQPSELVFEIVEPASDDDHWTIIWAVANMQMKLGRLEEAERTAFEILERFGRARFLAGLLTDLYMKAGLEKRSFEMLKEHLRTLKRRRGHDGSWARPYSQLAVATGAAGSVEEGKKQYDEFLRKADAGEDTGELPEAYLRPALGPPPTRGKWKLGALAIGVVAGGAILVVVGLFVFVRKRERQGES